MTDLRYALRQLVKRPGFSLVVILTLALGIGANVGMFSLLHAVLFRPLPFPEPDRLVTVWERRGGSRDADLPVSAHEFVAWKERNRVFSHVALIAGEAWTLTGHGDPVQVRGRLVSADFFPMLGVAPAIGNVFTEGDRAAPAPVAVLSDRLWRERFDADAGVVGRGIALDDRGYTVVGVMPPLPAALSPDLWLPLDLPAAARAVGRHHLDVLARLDAGVTLERARADLARIARDLERELPASNTDHGVAMQGLHDQLAGDLRMPLVVLLAAVGFVLLIGCVNVANLLLARTARRRRELAVRAALGADRRRLVSHVLVEGLTLAAIGGGLGVLLAGWTVEVIPAVLAADLPFADRARIDTPVLLVALGLSLLCGVLTGLGPAIRLSRRAVGGLADGARTTTDRHGRRLRSALVSTEVALAVVLLVGAGLMLNSFVRLLRVDPGFSTRNVMVVGLDLPGTRYPEAETRRAFVDELQARLGALPGVVAVGATSNLPLAGSDNWMPFAVEGRPAPAPGQELSHATRVVTPGYFRALEIPLRRGRLFGSEDLRPSIPIIRWYPEQPAAPYADAPQAAPVAIVSEALARRYWPDEDPIGRQIRVLFSPPLTIVGVVGDVKHGALIDPAYPHVYLSHAQEPWGWASIVVRTSVPPSRVAGQVREQFRALDPTLPVTIRTMDDLVSGSVADQRFYAFTVALFGFVALALAVMGVFGVVSYTTAERTTEIGVRVALGARSRDILRVVVGQGMLPIVVGVGIGTGGALVLSRLVSGLLFDVTPVDPPTYLGAGLLMLFVAFVACWLPARRASRVSPVEALHHD